MCGINVIYRGDGLGPEDIHTIHSMNSGMRYRGPDDVGHWSGKHAALGMVRLSIIGLQSGKQPLKHASKELVLVGNGEIYNYIELRRSLELKGYQFQTDSDLECILYLYEEKGENCLEDLRGMFAIALWDGEKKKLIVARDRFGEKPLYFTKLPNGAVFSSELKAIKENLSQSWDIDHSQLRQSYWLSYPLDPRNTWISQIQKVLPGEMVVLENNQWKHRTYWDLSYEPNYRGTRKQAEEDVFNAIQEAVELSTRADVPIGVLLSSGIDSSAISVLAHKARKDITAFTAGYKGLPQCDERPLAKWLANREKIDWQELEIGMDDFDQYLHELLPHIDEPVSDIASLVQWGIYKKASQEGFKVLLSGNGGDEIFFGYPLWNRVGHVLNLGSELEKTKYAFSQIAHPRVALEILKVQKKNYLNSHHLFRQRWKIIQSLQWPDGANQFSKGDEVLVSDQQMNSVDKVYKDLIKTWLPANCLFLADRLGMGNSLEVRSPFLDHKLAELVCSLPFDWRFSLENPKALLRKVLASTLPKEILEQPKRGFTPPNSRINKLVRKYWKSGLDFGQKNYHGFLINHFLEKKSEPVIKKTA